jgi:hypothetical protein
VSDDDLQRMPLRDLWLSELGPVVREYRRPQAPEVHPDLPPAPPRHATRDHGGRFAPDPTRQLPSA